MFLDSQIKIKIFDIFYSGYSPLALIKAVIAGLTFLMDKPTTHTSFRAKVPFLPRIPTRFSFQRLHVEQ